MKLNLIANRPFWLMLGWLVVAVPAHSFYDPSLGRWINRDPIGEEGGVNLHTFVLNNPVDWRDAFGFITVPGELKPVPPDKNTLVCKGGKLTVQMPKKRPDNECTKIHEEVHKKDWEDRYGPDLCQGVKDGYLPVGGDGYQEFRKESECKAHKAGLECREKLRNKCPQDDLPEVIAGIVRDKAYLRDEKNGCK